MEKYVGKKLNAPLEMLRHGGGVYACLLFCGVCVEFAPHAVDAVQYVVGMAFLRAFENGVFYKVRHAFLARCLVAGAGVHINAAVYHCRLVASENNTYAVCKAMILVYFGAVGQGNVFLLYYAFGKGEVATEQLLKFLVLGH